MAKRGSKSVYSVEPDQREYLSVLSCINARGGSVPNFYILKGTYFLQDYIAGCEEGAVMGMQPNAWMTRWLFESWILHFIECLKRGPSINLNNRHLLVLGGHNSHVTLEVKKIAMQLGLDIISLPSHTSHALQPLDLACFAPFKTTFRKHKDSWTLVNRNVKVGKKELYEWTCKVLQCTLTPKNINSGFRKARIWSLDRSVAKGGMRPSIGFVMEDSGSYENDSILGSRRASTSTGADQVPTQGPYPDKDRGGRSLPVSDLGELDGSARRQQSPLDPGHRAWHGREGSPPESEAAASNMASETDTEARGAEETGSADVDTAPHILYGRLQEDMRPCHYYVDFPHAEESTYDVHEQNVPIDPQFYIDLEEHNNNISQFLALLEVIPVRKRKKQQPFLDFSRPKFSHLLLTHRHTKSCLHREHHVKKR